MKIDRTRNIDQLYDELPEEERLTAIVLRELIFDTIEVRKEKLAWGAPFYYGHSPICFVWPASIPWGRMQKGVSLGFWRGRELDGRDYLDREGLKQLSRKIFLSAEEIEVERVQALLREAEALDRYHYEKRKKKGKSGRETTR